jgi:hypothetical protein
MHDATAARIETDEDGMYLVVSTLVDTHRFRLAMPVAEELHDSVRADIRPWLLERDAARYRMQAFRCDPDESAGLAEAFGFSTREELDEFASEAYDLSDPKHPDFHSVHVDHYDNREDK